MSPKKYAGTTREFSVTVSDSWFLNGRQKDQNTTKPPTSAQQTHEQIVARTIHVEYRARFLAQPQARQCVCFCRLEKGGALIYSATNLCRQRLTTSCTRYQLKPRWQACTGFIWTLTAFGLWMRVSTLKNLHITCAQSEQSANCVSTAHQGCGCLCDLVCVCPLTQGHKSAQNPIHVPECTQLRLIMSSMHQSLSCAHVSAQRSQGSETI